MKKFESQKKTLGDYQENGCIQRLYRTSVYSRLS